VIFIEKKVQKSPSAGSFAPDPLASWGWGFSFGGL